MTRDVVITAAQANVLRELIDDGGTNRQIGRRLGLAEDTIKTHMKGLLAAAKVPDRTALAVGVATGLIRPAVKGRDVWHRDNDTRRSA